MPLSAQGANVAGMRLSWKVLRLASLASIAFGVAAATSSCTSDDTTTLGVPDAGRDAAVRDAAAMDAPARDATITDSERYCQCDGSAGCRTFDCGVIEDPCDRQDSDVCQNRDAWTVHPDSGVEHPDTGEPHADSGLVHPDTGGPHADGGPAACPCDGSGLCRGLDCGVRDVGFFHPDTGFAHPDTGFAHRDTGFGHPDSGVVHADVGFAHPDTGVGSSDAGSGALQWYLTCGGPITRCNPPEPGMTIRLCTTETERDPCAHPDDQCQRRDRTGCAAILRCTDHDPRLPGCPRSSRSAKRDIRYLAPDDLARLSRALEDLRLASYVYRDDPQSKERLGFIIEDGAPAVALDRDESGVDLYGYASLAVATLQVQAARIARLEADLARLEAELRGRRAVPESNDLCYPDPAR